MIYVNGRFLSQPATGVQRFAWEIFASLSEVREDIVLLAPPNSDISSRLHPKTKFIGKLHGHAWEQISLPNYLRARGNPLLVNLCNTAPLFYNNSLVTLHDVTYLRHPESYSHKFRLMYTLLMPALLRRARAIATVSSFSRDQISESYGMPSSKLTIIPNAAGKQFKTAITHRERPGAFFLAVASTARHKNLQFLIDAFAEGFSDSGVNLLIAGGATANFAGANIKIPDSVKGTVELLGRISDTDLVGLYQNAAAFIFPSLYEGFGIPPLEAMACGCPVIASDIPVTREVLGDAALFFDANSPESLLSAMKKIIHDKDLQNKMIRSGLTQASTYSWTHSASLINKLMNKLTPDSSRAGQH